MNYRKNRIFIGNVIGLFLLGFILISGCSSTYDGERESRIIENTITTSLTTRVTQIQSGDLDRSVGLANKIIPTEISGFSLKYKGKDPMSETWGDQYTLESGWTPKTGSIYAGYLDDLLVKVFIYENSDKAIEWYTVVWEKNSDSSIQVGNKKGVYRYELGEATITFRQDNCIILIDSLYDTQPPSYYHDEGITKKAALEAANQVVANLNRFS